MTKITESQIQILKTVISVAKESNKDQGLEYLFDRAVEIVSKIDPGFENPSSSKDVLSDRTKREISNLTEIALMPNAEYFGEIHNSAVRYLRNLAQ